MPRSMPAGGRRVWPLQNAVTGRGAARRIDHPSIEVAPNRNTSPASIDAESTAARAQRPRRRAVLCRGGPRLRWLGGGAHAPRLHHRTTLSELAPAHSRRTVGNVVIFGGAQAAIACRRTMTR